MSSDAAALPSSLEAVGRRLRRAHELVGSLSPRKALAALIVVQWLAVAALALTVKHNGWLYYAGGDQLWHYTGAYLLAHGHLPATFVGYGWSILLLPVAAVAGPNLASALPAIVLFNTVVLLAGCAPLRVRDRGAHRRTPLRLLGSGSLDRAALPRASSSSSRATTRSTRS